MGTQNDSEALLGLIEAGLFDGVAVCRSPIDDYLNTMATAHAHYQADHCRQGHQRWNHRYAELAKEFGEGYTFHEICAESWPEQADDNYIALGSEMYKCWRQSDGHWAVANKIFDAFGGGMAKGSNGIWYACIITAGVI